MLFCNSIRMSGPSVTVWLVVESIRLKSQYFIPELRFSALDARINSNWRGLQSTVQIHQGTTRLRMRVFAFLGVAELGVSRQCPEAIAKLKIQLLTSRARGLQFAPSLFIRRLCSVILSTLVFRQRKKKPPSIHLLFTLHSFSLIPSPSCIPSQRIQIYM